MAPHSSTLAWKIPWTAEPGRLQSMGSRRVGHDCSTSLSLFTFMHWRRKWQPTPVFLPGESQGRGSLVGCRPWGRTELDTTEHAQNVKSAIGFGIRQTYILIPHLPKGASAAAKSLQSCPTLCNPIDSSPSGSTIPGILQARTLEWVAISFSNA